MRSQDLGCCCRSRGPAPRFPAGRRGVAAQYRTGTPQGLYGADLPAAVRGSLFGVVIARVAIAAIPLGGGVPIKIGEETIGGVGLSGAPMGQGQEEACAKAGIAKVADQLR